MRKRRTLVSGTVALGGLLFAFGCSSEDSSDPAGFDGGGKQASGGGAGASAASGGSAGLIITSGGSAGSGVTSSGGSGAVEECAGDVSNAELLPLDIYIMFDSSGSMLEMTAAGVSKWDAVSSALEAFLADPASAGIGVGMQFFPLLDPNVPASCNSDAECGTHGPCFQRFCQTAGPDFFACSSNADCRTADGLDAGPCTPVTYCWSNSIATNPTLVLCHDDSECTGGAGDCVPFNECSLDTSYSCKVAGQACSTALGTCRAFNPTSVCTHTSDCSAAVYAAPAVEIAELPGAAATLAGAINLQDPAGGTPSAPAITGALDHARSWAAAHPDHKVVALLATDGLPTECITDPTGDPTGIAGVEAAATAGLTGTPSISTFVIGVFAPTDTDARPNLDRMARAGGSDAAFFVDTSQNVEQEFLSALDEIRGSRLPCEFQIPKPAAGKTLDYQKVNVQFSSAGNQQTLYYWPSEGECNPTDGGWHYDVDPSQGMPTKIIACPASCSVLQAATDGSVAIQLGCTTVSVVK